VTRVGSESALEVEPGALGAVHVLGMDDRRHRIVPGLRDADSAESALEQTMSESRDTGMERDASRA
jgi:hypothetical protein